MKDLKMFKDLFRGENLTNKKVELFDPMSRSLYSGPLNQVPEKYDSWFVLDIHSENQFGDIITLDYYGY